MLRVLIILCVIFLTACESRINLAPVTDAKLNTELNRSIVGYRVKRGDTLYSIAFRFDKNYQTLARINQLSQPYRLYVGQIIWLVPRASTGYSPAMHPVKRTQPPQWHAPKRTPPTIQLHRTGWVFPVASGHLLKYFSPSQGQKGIDIGANRGTRVRACADGVVAYAGNGLNGYGNLIIIKHENQLLTAYGHNARNFVREGQRVKKGEMIAEIGMLDRRHWGVHFEMRLLGKPVNPLQYVKP